MSECRKNSVTNKIRFVTLVKSLKCQSSPSCLGYKTGDSRWQTDTFTVHFKEGSGLSALSRRDARKNSSTWHGNEQMAVTQFVLQSWREGKWLQQVYLKERRLESVGKVVSSSAILARFSPVDKVDYIFSTRCATIRFYPGNKHKNVCPEGKLWQM